MLSKVYEYKFGQCHDGTSPNSTKYFGEAGYQKYEYKFRQCHDGTCPNSTKYFGEAGHQNI